MEVYYLCAGKPRSGFRQCRRARKKCHMMKSFKQLGQEGSLDGRNVLWPNLKIGNLGGARSSQISTSSYSSCCSKCCIGTAFLEALVPCANCVTKCGSRECIKGICANECEQYLKTVHKKTFNGDISGKHVCHASKELCIKSFNAMLRLGQKL